MDKQYFIDCVYPTLLYKPFTQADWWAWSGCNTKAPLISYFTHNDKDWVSIVDGDVVCYYDLEQDDCFSDVTSEEIFCAVTNSVAS